MTCNFDVGGTEEIRNEFGGLVERAQPAKTVELHVPTIDDLKPVHAMLMDTLEAPYIREDGTFIFKDSVQMTTDDGQKYWHSNAMIEAIQSVRELFFKEMPTDERTWVDMMLTDAQATRLTTMVNRVIGLSALVKAKKEGLTAGN